VLARPVKKEMGGDGVALLNQCGGVGFGGAGGTRPAKRGVPCYGGRRWGSGPNRRVAPQPAVASGCRLAVCPVRKLGRWRGIPGGAPAQSRAVRVKTV
jgi:hypothetical protein